MAAQLLQRQPQPVSDGAARTFGSSEWGGAGRLGDQGAGMHASRAAALVPTSGGLTAAFASRCPQGV